jgi:hypothetical protein
MCPDLPDREPLDCGNIDSDMTSKGGGVDRFDNTLHVRAQLRPLLAPKNHNCDFSSREILLIANMFVRRQEHIEAGVFGSR